VSSPVSVKDSVYGLFGTVVPMIAVITSYQEQIEFSIRLASMVAALVASILYCVSAVRKMK